MRKKVLLLSIFASILLMGCENKKTEADYEIEAWFNENIPNATEIKYNNFSGSNAVTWYSYSGTYMLDDIEHKFSYDSYNSIMYCDTTIDGSTYDTLFQIADDLILPYFESKGDMYKNVEVTRVRSDGSSYHKYQSNDHIFSAELTGSLLNYDYTYDDLVSKYTKYICSDTSEYWVFVRAEFDNLDDVIEDIESSDVVKTFNGICIDYVISDYDSKLDFVEYSVSYMGVERYYYEVHSDDKYYLKSEYIK